jgi:AraC-like DNA-binding protein
LHLLDVGQTLIPPNTPYPPARHPSPYHFDWSRGRTIDEFQIVHLSAGRGWLETANTRRQRIESGDTFLLFPGVWHRYRPDAKTGWTEHWVGFDGSIVRQWMKLRFLSTRRPIVHAASDAGLIVLFTQLLDLVRSNHPSTQSIGAALTHQIIATLHAGTPRREPMQPKVHQAIGRAIEQMSSRPEAAIDLHELAESMGFSYAWFRRQFVRHTGFGPHHYQAQLRMSRARQLLRSSDLSVKQVARAVGFEDDHYFCRAFRKATGLTPTSWRTGKQSRAVR